MRVENAEVVLDRARGKTVDGIKVLVAELAPKPDVVASIRRVPACSVAVVAGDESPANGCSQEALLPSLKTVPAAKRLKVQPLAPARYHVSFTASEALKRNLDRAKELAGHGVKVEEVIEDAVALFVEELEKRKLGVAGRKAGKVANPRGRPKRSQTLAPEGTGPWWQGRSSMPVNIAKAVRRAVEERDGRQCTFVDGSGHRCSARMGLEFDHVVPYGRGGTGTVGNLRLRCRAHNQLHAEQCFGPLFMAGKRDAARPTANGDRPAPRTPVGGTRH